MARDGTLPPASGAWREADHPGERRFLSLGRFTTRSGFTFPDVRVAYQTWGPLHPDRSNTIYIAHALSGDSHVCGPAGPGHRHAGWWNALVGPERPIDTRRWFVVCANVLGGCQGTTGPASAAPDGTPWGSRFPLITVADMVEVERRFSELLGIRRWACILGPSLGGMRVLEWMVAHPQQVAQGLVIGAAAAVGADQIGSQEAQIGLLLLLTLLFAPLLLSGTARGAVAPLALQAVIGATLFGVGMQLGSGCACGTLHAIGGGSGLMLFTLAGFSTGSFLATLTPGPWGGLPRLAPFSLLEQWGWPGALLQLVVLALVGLALWLWRRPRRHPSFHGGRRFPWRTLLVGPWSLGTGTFALALLSGLTLWLAGRPWGVTWGFTLWAAKLAHQLGWDPSASTLWQQARFAQALSAGLFEDITSVMNLGIVLGAAAAAAAAGGLSFRSPPSANAVGAALVGGLMMGYGSWLSFGCNVGAFLAGIASTSLHGWLWIVFALLGTAIGVRLRPRFGLPN